VLSVLFPIHSFILFVIVSGFYNKRCYFLRLLSGKLDLHLTCCCFGYSDTVLLQATESGHASGLISLIRPHLLSLEHRNIPSISFVRRYPTHDLYQFTGSVVKVYQVLSQLISLGKVVLALLVESVVKTCPTLSDGHDPTTDPQLKVHRAYPSRNQFEV